MTIKIFDLCCANGHVFEGWFSSTEDFESQNSKKLIACPICSDTHIERRPSPSRIGRSSKGSDAAPPDLEAMRERFEAIMAQVREAAVKAEDVGDGFAHEAREIQAGRAPERNIRGRCTAREALELVEEGISVLPIPESTGKTLN